MYVIVYMNIFPTFCLLKHGIWYLKTTTCLFIDIINLCKSISMFDLCQWRGYFFNLAPISGMVWFQHVHMKQFMVTSPLMM